MREVSFSNMTEQSKYREYRNIPMNELIYWIDKEFVQWRASKLVGRELNDDEIERTTKFIEYGLSDAVLEVVDIAIDETISEKLNANQ